MDIDIVLLLTTTFDATSTNITTSPIVACFFRRWISSIKEMILLFQSRAERGPYRFSVFILIVSDTVTSLIVDLMNSTSYELDTQLDRKFPANNRLKAETWMLRIRRFDQQQPGVI